jgi:hypothetical protein
MASPAPAPHSLTDSVVDKYFTAIMNCMHNVVYVFMLLRFLELGMFYISFAAHSVSPVESWKGLFYNMWFGSLVLGMMLAFKITLETLILFENAKRARDSRKDATTTLLVTKTGAQINHVDYGSSIPAWPGVACFLAHKFSAKDEQKEDETAKDATTQNEEDVKEAATPSSTTEDEIKPETASASSSARSSADTSEVLN